MLSHKFRTIFVHIPKTGGQSVEMAFIRAHKLRWRTRAPLLLRLNRDPSKGPRRLAHLFARQYLQFGHVDAETFAAYFKFTVVRDPYDRFISFYNYRRHEAGDTPESVFDNFDDGSFTSHFMAPQTEYLTDLSGNIIVDKIVRFEHLNEEMPAIFERTIGKPKTLRHVNKSIKKRITRADIGPGLQQKLYKYYEADFERFAYPAGLTS